MHLIAPKLTKISVSFDLVDAKVDANLNSDFPPNRILVFFSSVLNTVFEYKIKHQFHCKQGVY